MAFEGIHHPLPTERLGGDAGFGAEEIVAPAVQRGEAFAEIGVAVTLRAFQAVAVVLHVAGGGRVVVADGDQAAGHPL